MQVIQDSSSGGRIGAALGQGLQQLAHNQLQHVQKQYYPKYEKAEYAKGIAPIVGERAAEFLSNLDPKERKVAFENIGALMALSQQNQGQEGQEQAGGLAALGGAEQPQQAQGLSAADLLRNGGSVSPLLRQALSQAPVQGQAQGQGQPNALQGAPQQQQQGQPVPNNQANLVQELFTSPQTRAAREKLELDKQKITSREDIAAWKNTLPYREKVLEAEQTSREALRSIKEAQELEKSGEFPSQQFASFLKGAEWEDVPGFLSGKAEAYNKILANFQRGAKDIYGGRITNFEMEQFLKTIPTLQHTPEGRARIWSMMKNYYRGGKEVAKLEREVIRENGGKPPQDLHERVNEKFRPISKQLSKRFKKDLEEAEKLASSYSSRFGSAASYGLGKAVKALPGVLGGAAKGALTGAAAGSVFPGLGTGLGAGLGAGVGALGGGGLGDLLKTLL